MASKENVDIIVFPELGLGGNLDSREAVFPYLEDIPEMSETEVDFCWLIINNNNQ